MPVPTDPYTFADGPGNTASGVQVNQRFTPIYNALNPAVVGLDYQNVQANGLRETNMATAANGLAKGAFSVYRSAVHNLADGAQVVFDAEEFDVSGWHDVATGRYTPQVPGYYRLSWGVVSTAVITVDSYMRASLFKNGVLHKQGSTVFQRGAAALPTSTGSASVIANGTTDYFTVIINFTTGGTIPVASQSGTYFTGELVGRS